MTCIVVRRGAYVEYDRLNEAFGHRVPVMWDPRRDPDPTPGSDFSISIPNRRRGKPPVSWIELGFIVVDRLAE